MKKLFTFFFLGIASLLFFSSCKDDVEITTGEAFNVTGNSASVTCIVESDDISMSDIDEFGVLFSTSKGTVESGAGFEAKTAVYSDNSYTVNLSLSGLNNDPEPGTKFYYRGYVLDGNDYYYGNVKSFSTPK